MLYTFAIYLALIAGLSTVIALVVGAVAGVAAWAPWLGVFILADLAYRRFIRDPLT